MAACLARVRAYKILRLDRSVDILLAVGAVHVLRRPVACSFTVHVRSRAVVMRHHTSGIAAARFCTYTLRCLQCYSYLIMSARPLWIRLSDVGPVQPHTCTYMYMWPVPNGTKLSQSPRIADAAPLARAALLQHASETLEYSRGSSRCCGYM